MAGRTLLALAFCFLAAIDAVTATNEYVYEFGSKRGGEQVYDREGKIGVFGHFTTIQVRVPRNTRISYLKVTVYSVSSPKVDFDEQSYTVSIKYSWTQITLSTYRIFAKGVPDN